MIHYSASKPADFARWTGSVAPKALRWAVPSMALSVFYHWLIHEKIEGAEWLLTTTNTEMTGFSLFTSILGFLIVFRAQLSYARYWEGITLAERACGVWLNGFSNLIAFCSTEPEMLEEVESFQYLLSRLMSLTLGFAMCDISNLPATNFDHLDLSCLDPAGVGFLMSTKAKPYVALQWIQRLVVENAKNGVIDISAPILSRVFQEFSIGIVHFIDAKKLQAVPFPFEFAQMVWIMLVFFSVVPVPLICAVGMDEYKGALYTFMIVFVFWSVHHIAVEIEMPFGDDPNDLPLDTITRKFNLVLLRLMEAKAQSIPVLIRRPGISVRSEVIESTIVTNLARESAVPCGRCGACLAPVVRWCCPGLEKKADPQAARRAAKARRAATLMSLREECRSENCASSIGAADSFNRRQSPGGESYFLAGNSSVEESSRCEGVEGPSQDDGLGKLPAQEPKAMHDIIHTYHDEAPSTFAPSEEPQHVQSWEEPRLVQMVKKPCFAAAEVWTSERSSRSSASAFDQVHHRNEMSARMHRERPPDVRVTSAPHTQNVQHQSQQSWQPPYQAPRPATCPSDCSVTASDDLARRTVARNDFASAPATTKHEVVAAKAMPRAASMATIPSSSPCLLLGSPHGGPRTTNPS